MTVLTPEHVVFDTENLLQSVVGSIRDLRHEIESLREKARAGEKLDNASNNKTVAEAKSLLRTCQEVENRLVECSRQTAGIAKGGYALDLEKARADIGCKLDRLRTTAGAG
jgi:hypothetical protein